MQFGINRQIYAAAIISMILFGIVQTESVKGSELLTENVTEEASVQSTPGILDHVRTHVQAFTAGRFFSGASLDNFEGLLHQAILDRVGVPYRSGGTDNNGYDCSGFVWRVFQEAGINFERASARTYWNSLPQATEEEKTQFGTLVFFDNSTHVGVVRDSYSFYHASSSQGVTRSNFSDYWGAHIRGFRRVPLSGYLIASR